ncbi:MAG: flagellar hook-associated protein FlgK [Armatimonadetes bacterium]|nr:flagellar hook-associated protein FlgK [Armatimonadota bacterium]
MSFVTLEIARNAMTASRVAMDVAAQNVANANTPGYFRQRALLAPLTNAAAGGVSQVGLGAQVAEVQRLRDQCLEAQIAHQEGELGREQALGASLARIEQLLPDLDGNGIASVMGRLFDSLQRLQTSPDSLSARREVLATAEAMCVQFRDTAQQLAAEAATIERELDQSVDRANQLLAQVAELNGKIAAAGGGSSANDLRVAREQAIRELGNLCGAVGLDQADGSQTVLLGGIRLVQGSRETTLALVTDPGDPSHRVLAAGDLTELDGLSGQIGGYLEARDGNLRSWQSRLDTLAATLADALNATHAAGYDLAGQTGSDFLTYQPEAAARTLGLAVGLSSDPRLLAAAGQPGGSPGDGANAAAMAALREARLFEAGSQTPEEFHADLLLEVGVAARGAEEAVAARQLLLESLDRQYADQAAVSLDEEAVDIMRYQQVYNASARLVQTALDMVDQLLGLVR